MDFNGLTWFIKVVVGIIYLTLGVFIDFLPIFSLKNLNFKPVRAKSCELIDRIPVFYKILSQRLKIAKMYKNMAKIKKIGKNADKNTYFIKYDTNGV